MKGFACVRRGVARTASVALCLTLLLAAERTFAQEATNEEYALLVLANEARSDPSAFGFDRPVVPPLRWNDELARAARAHSADMAENGCYQHDSCNGQTWWKRIQSFYAGWTGLAENIIAIGDTPQQLHDGWMNSSGHRANILAGGLYDFGAGILEGDGAFGRIAFATEDFGVRALPSLRSLPAIPAGAVLPRTGPVRARELVANFYDYDGPPRSVHALVDGSCVPLALRTGVASHGTYAATRTFGGSGCVPLAFEAVDEGGRRHRFPAEGAILIAVGDASCAQRTSVTPAETCGGSSGPTPTPVPTATPEATADPEPTPDDPGDALLRRLRVVLAPGPANESKGQVTLVANLPPDPDFDPRGLPIRLGVRFSSGDWVRSLPALCDDAPCLEATPRGNAFRARYDQSSRLSFTRNQQGAWTLRYFSRGDTIGRVAPGLVTVTVELADRQLTASAPGRMNDERLVAE